jgi:hypothetical protein
LRVRRVLPFGVVLLLGVAVGWSFTERSRRAEHRASPPPQEPSIHTIIVTRPDASAPDGRAYHTLRISSTPVVSADRLPQAMWIVSLRSGDDGETKTVTYTAAP